MWGCLNSELDMQNWSLSYWLLLYVKVLLLSSKGNVYSIGSVCLSLQSLLFHLTPCPGCMLVILMLCSTDILLNLAAWVKLIIKRKYYAEGQKVKPHYRWRRTFFFCCNRRIIFGNSENNWSILIPHKLSFLIVDFGLLKSEKTRRKWDLAWEILLSFATKAINENEFPLVLLLSE